MKLFSLICFLNAVIGTQCNVSLIAEQFDNGTNFTCVLEGDSLQSAVTWIAPIESNEASRYLPELKILCNYTAGKANSKECIPSKWTINQAIDFQFKPIRDYRWESFPIIRSAKSKRKQLFKLSRNTFRMTLSFRIKYNASLYLCSSQRSEDLESNCFVIFLNKTLINIYSLDKQKTLLNSTCITKFKENAWTELIITHRYINNRKILKAKIENAVCIGKTEEYDVKGFQLFVQSEEVSSWKVHNYWFLSTSKAIDSTAIGAKITVPPSNQTCVSLYVAVCPTCIMIVSIDSQDEIPVSKKVENFYIQDEDHGETYSWQEIKLITNINATKFNVYLIAKNNNKSTHGFWAVDYLRTCDTNEIRVSNLFVKDNNAKKNIQCQVFHENPISIYNPINRIGCEQSNIGASCNIPCESIFGEVNGKYCQRKLICDQSNYCYCASGYQGPTCQKECDIGSWGSGCNNICKNCKEDTCHPVIGSCSKGCIEGFASPSCIDPTTVQNIRSTKATSTSIEIAWDFPSPHKFLFKVIYYHHKHIACKNNETNSKLQEITINNTQLVIEKLLPYSEYHFKIAAMFDNIQGDFTNFNTSSNYTEMCDSDEVPIEVIGSHEETGTIPLIILREPRCSNINGPLEYEATFNCSEEWCKKTSTSLRFNYTNSENTDGDFSKSVSNLIPYSNYVVTVAWRRFGGIFYPENVRQTQFQTKESKPPKVTNLLVYSRSENAISLRWKAPYPPHGTIDKYEISCTTSNLMFPKIYKTAPCELWEENYTCANVPNLKKNLRYTVQVKAKNNGVRFYGDAEYQSNIVTEEQESEAVLNVKSIWDDQDTVRLQWEHPLITNGPIISFTIEINVVTSEYYKQTNFTSTFIIEKYNRTYSKVLNLNVSSVYKALVYPVNKYKGKPSKEITIKMPPPTPHLLYSPNLKCMNLKCNITHLKPINVSDYSSYIYVIVETLVVETLQHEKNTIQLLTDSAENGKSETNWLAIAMPIRRITNDFVHLGDGSNTSSFYGLAINKPLLKDVDYRVTVILANSFLNKTRFSQTYPLFSGYAERLVEINPSDKTQQAHAIHFALYSLFLLLLIPMAIGGWILYNKRNKQRNGNSKSSEDLNLKTLEERRKDAKQISKPVGIVKPETCDLVDATSPLIPQELDEDVKYRCVVKLEDLEEYVKQSMGNNEEDGELVRQYALFVRGQTKPWEYGLKKENRFKNRYNNHIAYDHSRVKLEKINNDEFSDYINANYIDGYNQPKAYIATQGPKPTTVCDFWRMVWEKHVTTIVMVANVKEDGKKKTEEYWPKLNCELNFGAIEVHHQKSEMYSNYVFRTLTITKGAEERTIEQLHFTSWPDHGVPLYPQTLVPFIAKIRSVPQDAAPIVVHCSAGVGRTGTIILCDYILRMANCQGSVDFLATLQEMREQRANLVDNPTQYKLAHLVVLETLFGLDFTVPCDYELEEKISALVNNHDLLYAQMDYLDKVIWQDQTMSWSYQSSLDPANKMKNRFSNILPDGYGRIYMTRNPVTEEHSDYINAVEVDGFYIPKRFIVTQQPLPGTVSDFWRMVLEKQTSTIVSLNDIEPCDPSSCIFWPEGEDTLDLKFAIVKYVEKEEYATHDSIKLNLMNTNDDESNEFGRNINMIKMKGWPPLKVLPGSLHALMETWNESDKVSRCTNPIVVTCYDGAKASGVFVALSFVIEKMKLEQVCDVCLAVRTIRRSRKEFIGNVDQFELLYEAAVQYLKSFETYSNFSISNK